MGLSLGRGRSLTIDALARHLDSSFQSDPQLNSQQVKREQSLPVPADRPHLLKQFPSSAVDQLSPEQAAHYESIAAYFAPRIYQDTDHAKYRDLPLAFDFAGSVNIVQNPQTLEQMVRDEAGNISEAKIQTLKPTVHDVVRETATHYFVQYVLYYPDQAFRDAQAKFGGIPLFLPNSDSFDHDQDIEFITAPFAKSAPKNPPSTESSRFAMELETFGIRIPKYRPRWKTRLEMASRE